MSTPELVVDGADRRVAALNAFAAAAAAGVFAALSDPRLMGPMDWPWPAAAGALLGGLAAVVPLRRGKRAAAAVLAACWAGPCEWVAYGWGTGRLWDSGYWLALAAGAAVLGMAASVWSTPTDFGQPMRIAAVQDPGLQGGAGSWPDRIARIAGVKGAHSVRVEEWATGAGHTVTVRLDGTGATWQALQQHASAFATDLALPAGCGVTVGPGDTRASVTLDVATADAMAEPQAYPGLDED